MRKRLTKIFMLAMLVMAFGMQLPVNALAMSATTKWITRTQTKAAVELKTGAEKVNLKTTKSSKKTSKKAKALQAYRKMLSSKSQMKKQLGKAYRNKSLSSVSFAIAYIDNDNVPELIVNSGNQYLFTYRNGVIRLVYSFDQNGIYSPFGYYRKKGVYCGYEGYHYVSLTYYILRSGNGELFDILAEQDAQTGDIYSDMGKQISTKKFKAMLKSRCGNTKRTVIQVKNFKKNTSANRKKYLK